MNRKEVLADIEDDTEAQAYTDIALKINALKYSSTGDDLSNAMNTLTAALHKNPSRINASSRSRYWTDDSCYPALGRR